MATKAQLLEMIAARNAEITKLQSSLSASEAASRRHEQDAKYEGDKARELQAVLMGARFAVVHELVVRHDTELLPRQCHCGPSAVTIEDVTEPVRFLRHLHATLGG